MILFHPDYTVGFGISPNQPKWLVGCTTGGELHPALKIFCFLHCNTANKNCQYRVQKN